MPQRVIVKNIRKDVYGAKGDVIRDGTNYKPDVYTKVDVGPAEYKAIRTAQSLEIVKEQDIKEDEVQYKTGVALSPEEASALEKELNKGGGSSSKKK